MAGSPGAGKSETVLFLKEKNKIDVIDIDELRKVFTNYNGKNSNLFQKASSKGASFLVDFHLKMDCHLFWTVIFQTIKCKYKMYKEL